MSEIIGNGFPSIYGVISVGHGLLSLCQTAITIEGPMKVKYHMKLMREESQNILANSVLVRLSSYLRMNSIDTKPAVLIDRYSHHIDGPLLHLLN